MVRGWRVVAVTGSIMRLRVRVWAVGVGIGRLRGGREKMKKSQAGGGDLA